MESIPFSMLGRNREIIFPVEIIMALIVNQTLRRNHRVQEHNEPRELCGNNALMRGSGRIMAAIYNGLSAWVTRTLHSGEHREENLKYIYFMELRSKWFEALRYLLRSAGEFSTLENTVAICLSCSYISLTD